MTLAFGVWRSAFEGLRHRTADGSNGTYETDETYKSHVSHQSYPSPCRTARRPTPNAERRTPNAERQTLLRQLILPFPAFYVGH